MEMPETIWAFDDDFWCEDAPTDETELDAVEYVRADIVDALRAEVEQLKKAIESWKKEEVVRNESEVALLTEVERLRAEKSLLVLVHQCGGECRIMGAYMTKERAVQAMNQLQLQDSDDAWIEQWPIDEIRSRWNVSVVKARVD